MDNLWLFPPMSEVEGIEMAVPLYVCLSFSALTVELFDLGKKSYAHIFERRSGWKIIKQNVPQGSDF